MAQRWCAIQTSRTHRPLLEEPDLRRQSAALPRVRGVSRGRRHYSARASGGSIGFVGEFYGQDSKGTVIAVAITVERLIELLSFSDLARTEQTGSA